MGIIVRERAQESALMEVEKRREFVCGDLEPELQLPCGWEKCLDLKSGLMYFKDWNSGTLTYRDPRQAVSLTTQRIGLLSISLPAEVAVTSNASEGAGRVSSKKKKHLNQRMQEPLQCRMISSRRYCSTRTVTEPQGTYSSSSATETTTSLSVDDDQCLELSLTLPGTTNARPVTVKSSQEESVCTMEKVRSALERSNWLRQQGPCRIPKKRPSPGVEYTSSNNNNTLSTALSLLSSRPSSSSRESNSPHDSSSPSTSQCSSDCFTSPSIMSYECDDEEVQQQSRLHGDWCSGVKSLQTLEVNSNGAAPSSNTEVMVTVGCKSCLMYVMLSKSHPTCPKCGNADVLLELPAPLPKKQRRLTTTTTGVDRVASPTWSWCTA